MKFHGILFHTGSGSIAGVTASHNKGGAYLKAKSNPTNPNSVRQQATRSLFGTFASRWSTLLSQAQRDLWNTYAQTHTIPDALGAPVYINGISWYIMFNTRLVDAGIAPIVVPPPAADPNGYDTFSVDISALNTVDVTFTDALGAAEVMQLWQTLPGTEGQTPNEKQARLVGYSGLAEASPWAATLPFGVASDEQATFYAKRMNSDGQTSVSSVDTDLADY